MKLQPKDLPPQDKFAKYVGIEIVESGVGFAKTQLEIRPYHLNGSGFIHGSVLFTLADFAFALAANSQDKFALLVSSAMNFVKAEKSGVVIAEAVEQSRSNKLATYQVKITHQADGSLLATFQGMAYLKDPS